MDNHVRGEVYHMICQLPWQTPRCGDVFSGPRMECIEGAVRSYGYP